MGDRWLKMQLQRNTMLSFAGKGTSEPTNSSLAQTASADAEFDLKLSLHDVRRALQAQILKSPTSMPLCSSFARALDFPECVLQTQILKKCAVECPAIGKAVGR